MSCTINIEVRVWGLKVEDKDELSQQIINWFRSNQFSGSKHSDTVGFHDLSITSMVNVDEPGENGVKSKVITIGGLLIIGG